MSLKETIKEIVKNHNLMHIATVDSNGMPCVRGVDYVMGESENILYFMTHKDSRKVEQIRNNENVAIAIDHDCPEWDDLQKLKFVKGTGIATIIEDPGEMKKVVELLSEKFPFLNDIPGDPSDFRGMKVVLKEILLTDNTVSFAHTETVNY